MPRVSIIMNCYNGEKYLREALDSAATQTYTDWEVVFWDNASTDKSAAIAKEYGDKVRYFRNDATTTLGEARNKAIAAARGEFITFLDVDDYWLPDKLQHQVVLMDANPDVGFLHANLYVLNSLNGTRTIATTKKIPDGYVFRTMLRDYNIGILSAMVRKSVLDSMESLFDEKLTHASDYDLFLRIVYKTKTLYLDEPVAVYRLHSGMYSLRAYNNNQAEIRYVLEKLAKWIPDFSRSYSGDLKPIQQKLEYAEIWMSLLKGELALVRRRSYILTTFNAKLILLYLSSFLNHGIWMRLWNAWNAVRGSKDAKQVILKDLRETK